VGADDVSHWLLRNQSELLEPVGAGYLVISCDLRIRMEQPTDFGTFR
jgi:hypothetical protein